MSKRKSARWHSVKLDATKREQTWVSPRKWSSAPRDVRVDLYSKGKYVDTLPLSGRTDGAVHFGRGVVAKTTVFKPGQGRWRYKQPIRVRFQALKSPRPLTIRYRVAKFTDPPSPKHHLGRTIQGDRPDSWLIHKTNSVSRRLNKDQRRAKKADIYDQLHQKPKRS